MGNLIDLQTAYATQTTTEENGKGEWVVYNTEEKEIHRLPKEWNERQIMAAIHLGRKFELIAFNKGIEFQRSKNPETIKTLQKMIISLTNDKEIMKKENIKLSNELDKLTLKYN